MLLRTIAILFSFLIHASLGLAMLPSLQKEKSEALDLGKGQDITLTPEGMVVSETVNLGDDIENIETAEVAPIHQQPPPPQPPDVKPPDVLHDVISSEQSQVEQEVVQTTEPPPPDKTEPQKVVKAEEPPKPIEEQKPEVQQAKEQPEQVAVVTELSSGEAKTGGDARLVGVYLGRINERVQRAKVNPRTSVAGVVVMRFTVATDGSLLSKEVATSSGSSALDQAAVAALDRAAPFPPIPPEVSVKPMAFTQPFKFVVR